MWAIIFDYGGAGAVPVQVDQIFRFRLLSRFITAGLDEWLLLAMEQGFKRDGSLRLVPANPNRSDSPIQVQKLGLLALSNAPKEFFPAITQLAGDFLTYNPWSGKNWSLMSRNRPRESGSVESSPPFWEQLVHSMLPQLPNLTCIGRHFLSWGGCFQVVDLSSMTELTTIGTQFLSHSSIGELLLPPSLKSVDTAFFAHASAKKVDLSNTAIETIGDYFFSSSKCDELLLPPSLKRVGVTFLVRSAVKKVDLSLTRLETVGVAFSASLNVMSYCCPNP